VSLVRYINSSRGKGGTTIVQGGAATPLATRAEVFGKTATTDTKAAPAEAVRLHCNNVAAHMPVIPADHAIGFATLIVKEVGGVKEFALATSDTGQALIPEKTWRPSDGALNLRTHLDIDGPYFIAWEQTIQLVDGPGTLGEANSGQARMYGNENQNRSISVQIFGADQIGKGAWKTHAKLQAGETDWTKWDGTTWTPWERDNPQGFTTELRNTFACNAGARLLYLMPVNNGRVALNLTQWQDRSTLSDIPEVRINPVLPNHWGNIDVTVPAGWTIDGIPARGVQELKIWKVPGQNAFTTSFTQHTGLIVFETWPTNADLRLAMDRGGFRAFLYVGAEAGKVVGTYSNPNVGRAVGVAITQPVKL
jgi:hypothetical protein